MTQLEFILDSDDLEMLQVKALIALLESQRKPDPVDPRSLAPARNIRKSYIQKGGLGNAVSITGHYSHHDLVKYHCVHCKKIFHWSPEMEHVDFGDVMDNLCLDCRKELRAMRTNHPEMK